LSCRSQQSTLECEGEKRNLGKDTRLRLRGVYRCAGRYAKGRGTAGGSAGLEVMLGSNAVGRKIRQKSPLGRESYGGEPRHSQKKDAIATAKWVAPHLRGCSRYAAAGTTVRSQKYEKQHRYK